MNWSLDSDPEELGYLPASRRPIAAGFRRTAHGAVQRCVRWRVPPDAISALSIVASALAGLCFWQAHPWLLVAGPLCCYVRLWLNMLDGIVALATGTASPRGEILNDLPDRISDVLVFAEVAHSGLAAPPSGYWAAIFALLTAYVGLLGQAVGVHREFSGVMAKPWRMVTLTPGPGRRWPSCGGGDGRPELGGRTLLDWTCLVIVLGCVETIAVRLRRILRAFRAQAAGGAR